MTGKDVQRCLIHDIQFNLSKGSPEMRDLVKLALREFENGKGRAWLEMQLLKHFNNQMLYLHGIRWRLQMIKILELEMEWDSESDSESESEAETECSTPEPKRTRMTSASPIAKRLRYN